ncbi:MAG: aspartate aminotransferase family protein [Anaerolineales bacterium]|nr:aspartate aminotransferase family protein [Anaerolineales bacterium]MCS7247480.1 aspartate aminotransferase family protein [Anaerolineales bacterium]MDW8161291.1 aspartate aminotransferase family protein [Anaerolineales bacterium]MDW8446407.1 aspartate aminotransferase family protein [Anaerolineales bacterium]
MVTPFEQRILEERKRMVESLDSLRRRVETWASGEKSKEILFKTLQYESTGHLDFALFPCPPVIDYGKGATLFDVDGKEYIDLHAGFTVNILGYAQEEINAAIKAQLDRVIQFAELPMESRAELARLLVERTGGDFEKKVMWAVTGGEAVEIAMKLARWYTGKPLIITHWGDYHGRTAGAMGLTSKAFMMAYSYPIPPMDTGIVKIPYPYCYRCPFGKEYPSCDLFCADQFEKMFESKETWLNNPKAGVVNVAAILIEPFQSSAGYLIPPLPYLQRMKEIAEKYDFVFISDEVQNGMGRTGKLWAIEHAGVFPDLITAAKSLANGLPLSVVIGRKEIMDSWGPGAHSSTFTGYPAACAGGVKLFEIFDRDHILEKAAEKGAYFLEGLFDLQRRHLSIGHVNGLGLYLSIELVKNRKTKEPASEATAWALRRLLEEGVICIYSGYFYNRLCFAPPLVIEKEEIDRALQILDRVLGEMEKIYETDFS